MAHTTVSYQLDEVELEENGRATEIRLTIHQLSQERELTEVNLTPAPEHKREENLHLQQREAAADQEYRMEVIEEGHGETTVVASDEPASTQQRIQEQEPEGTLRYEPPSVQQQQPPHENATGPKKVKHVHISFPRFGRRSQEGDVAHDTSGESQRPPVDVYAPITITFYPRYLLRPMGILRLVQLLLGIIVCSALNAEQCFLFDVAVCVTPSSRTWTGQLGGIGYVLFVGVLFILGNFAWIFYHLYAKPTLASAIHTPYSSRFSVDDRARLVEFVYDGAAIVLYIIAASVAAWYASWKEWPAGYYNPYRPQWITAAVFAWINTGFYGFSLVYSLLFA